jgi:hypothetical protein
VHVANNLYTSTVSNYLVGAGDAADELIESNVATYLSAKPIETSFSSTINFKAILARNNVGASGFNVTKNTAFTPPYQMPIDPTSNLEASLKSCAGATLPDPRTVTGIEEEALVDHIMAVPNPFVNELKIETPIGYTYSILDLQGRLVHESDGTNLVNTAGFASGLYVAILYKEGVRMKTLKLQKL